MKVTTRQFRNDILQNGGATYDPTTGEYNPTEGYMVSYIGTEVKRPQEIFITQDVRDFYKRFGSKIEEEGNYIGGWIEKGEVYLDVSTKIMDLYDAVRFAIENDQDAIWDAKRGEEIKRHEYEEILKGEYNG